MASRKKNNVEVQMLAEANSKPHDTVIYTDGSVTRDRSGWGFTVKQGGRTVYEDSHDLLPDHGGRSSHTCNTVVAIILTPPAKGSPESGMGCPDWHTAMHSLRLQRLLWIYCPGNTVVCGR